MAAQQLIDVRDVVGEAAAPSRQEQGKTAIDGNRHPQEDQAAAAAIVDAAQAAAEGGVLPTQAPLQGIGEIAQAPAPAPAAAETTAAATPATPAAEAGGLSPWAIGGIAALGVGGVAAVAGGGSDNAAPVAAPAPVPVPVPPPPPPADQCRQGHRHRRCAHPRFLCRRHRQWTGKSDWSEWNVDRPRAGRCRPHAYRQLDLGPGSRRSGRALPILRQALECRRAERLGRRGERRGPVGCALSGHEPVRH